MVDQECKQFCVNLRDVSTTSPGLVRKGMVFRSSEILSKSAMRELSIKTVLDLRRLEHECRHLKDPPVAEEGTNTTKGGHGHGHGHVHKHLRHGGLLGSVSMEPHHVDASPSRCSACEAKLVQKYGVSVAVVHADLIEGSVGLTIFRELPWRVRFRAIGAWASGKGFESVLAPAVADPIVYGYKKLYRTMLDHSKRGLARAFRVMASASSYPVLVHCTHGKDRTGIVVMLLLRLCGVPSEQVVQDYIRSEVVLKQSHLAQELHLHEYLTSDQVLAADAKTMEETITYLEDKWGSAEKYLHDACGLDETEIESIKTNIVVRLSTPSGSGSLTSTEATGVN